MWEIIDSDGTIYSGSEDDMRERFDIMCSDESEDEWSGDLKLIEVHAVTR